jgi:hypothetical protein
MGGRFGVAKEGGAQRTCGVKARGARPSIRLRKSSETGRDRADALGASRTGVDTRETRVPPFHLCSGRDQYRGYNEHLLAVAAWR